MTTAEVQLRELHRIYEGHMVILRRNRLSPVRGDGIWCFAAYLRWGSMPQWVFYGPSAQQVIGEAYERRFG